ncbi:MAG: hypothetical protein IK079_04030 [Desulfovibrio sp.]|nr:hypothetical protein [Desulfovibrio sp.]
MTESTLRVRIMLQGYEQQLLAARRLARFRARCREAAGEMPDDPDPTPKRSAYIEKVTKEIYDSLLYTGSDNPVIEEIRLSLSEDVGMQLLFTYPPGKRLQIVKVEGNVRRALNEEERIRVKHALYRITREKIDKHMLTAQ